MYKLRGRTSPDRVKITEEILLRAGVQPEVWYTTEQLAAFVGVARSSVCRLLRTVPRELRTVPYQRKNKPNMICYTSLYYYQGSIILEHFRSRDLHFGVVRSPEDL